MELRTDYQEADKDKGGGKLDGLLDKYIDNVKSNPAMKLRLLNAATENGIDPVLVAPLLDVSEEDMQRLQQAAAQQQQQQQNQQQDAYEQQEEALQNMESDSTQVAENEEVTPETLMEFLDELIGFTDEEMTLGELRELGKNNPDIMETAINIAFK